MGLVLIWWPRTSHGEPGLLVGCYASETRDVAHSPRFKYCWFFTGIPGVDTLDPVYALPQKESNHHLGDEIGDQMGAKKNLLFPHKGRWTAKLLSIGQGTVLIIPAAS